MTFLSRAQLFCVVRGTRGFILRGYDIWLAFHKVFPWEITVRSTGSANSAVCAIVRKTAFPALDVFQMIRCRILVIRNSFSVWSVSRIKNTEVSSASWGILIVGLLSSWGSQQLCRPLFLWGVTQSTVFLWVRPGSLWRRCKIVALYGMVDDFCFFF